MELLLIKTANGLKPAFDEDFEKYVKLKNGQAYKAKFITYRNLDFHRKYFSLLNAAWSLQKEATVNHFKTFESFRKTVQVAAGASEVYYSITRKEWIEESKSISFEKMEEHEFQELYERVKDVLYKYFLKSVSVEEFEKVLSNF